MVSAGRGLELGEATPVWLPPPPQVPPGIVELGVVGELADAPVGICNEDEDETVLFAGVADECPRLPVTVTVPRTMSTTIATANPTGRRGRRSPRPSAPRRRRVDEPRDRGFRKMVAPVRSALFSSIVGPAIGGGGP